MQGLVQATGEAVLCVGVSEMVNNEFINWSHFGHKGLCQQITDLTVSKPMTKKKKQGTK
jgi:hypothetical protein